MNRFIIALASCLAAVAAQAQNFDEHFTDETLRLDYIFAGNADTQMIALDEPARFGGWAGRRVNLREIPVKGNGEITLTDPATRDTLYRTSFSSLFQEWLVTDEARRLAKSFEATFLVPYPKHDIDVTILLRDNEGREQASLRHRITPDDPLIRDLSSREPAPCEYLLRSGSPAECIDVAIMAEGYTAEQMPLFLEDARTACDEIFRHEPFASMKERFNVVAVLSPSKDGAVSSPADGKWTETAVNSNFMTFYSPRYLTTGSVHRIHDNLAGIPCEHLIILANSDIYGGGGIYNSYTLTATHHAQFRPVVVHEFGHSFGALADEYFYDEPDHTENTYKIGFEPWEQNITSLVDFESKWADMVEKGISVPTEPTDERRRDYTVGVYEGGGYITRGMYRPAVTCRMRDNAADRFCPVCRRALERMIRYYTEQR